MQNTRQIMLKENNLNFVLLSLDRCRSQGMDVITDEYCQGGNRLGCTCSGKQGGTVDRHQDLLVLFGLQKQEWSSRYCLPVKI